MLHNIISNSKEVMAKVADFRSHNLDYNNNNRVITMPRPLFHLIKQTSTKNGRTQFKANSNKIANLYIKLTLSPSNTTIVPCANSLDTDEMPSNSASHPDPSCLTLRQHFHKT